MTEMSKAEFAASHGWSRPYVSKLTKNNRLVLTADGKVDVEASEALLAATSDPSKAGVAARHHNERVEKGVTVELQAGAGRTEIGNSKFQSARAHREHFLSLLAENEYRKSTGELVESSAVENAAFATGRMLRDLLLGLPKQLAPELAALTDPWELERRLTDALRRVLEDAERVSASDLENAIKPAN